jgi:hypothetical protein
MPKEAFEKAGNQRMISGVQKLEFIELDALSFTIPLRSSPVLEGTEQLDLDGRILRRGTDYEIDLAGGVIFLKTQYRAGQMLRVSYRQGGSASAESSAIQSAMQMRFNIGGGLTPTFSLAQASRFADGSVGRTNALGLENAMSFGGGTLSGAFMVTQTQKLRSTDGFGFTEDTEKSSSTSHLIVQRFESGVRGGRMSLEYQDIGKDFSAFGSMGGGNFSQNEINDLRRQAGIRRIAANMQDIDAGAFKFGSSFNWIGDGEGVIQSARHSIEASQFKMSFDTARIGKDFERFSALSGQERSLMERQAGLNKNFFSLSAGTDLAGFQFSASRVSQDEASASERSFSGKLGGATLSLGERAMDDSFRGASRLTNDERNLLGTDRGIRRNWLRFDSGEQGAMGQFRFDSLNLSRDELGARVESFSYRTAGVAIESQMARFDEGFRGFDAFSGDERTALIRQFGEQQGTSNLNPRRQELDAFNRLAGTSRAWQSIRLEPNARYSLGFSTLGLSRDEAGANLRRLDVKLPYAKLDARWTKIDEDFSGLDRGFEFDQKAMGVLPDLESQSISAAISPRKDLNLEMRSSSAQVGDHNADFLAYTLNAFGLRGQYQSYSATHGFRNVGRLLDFDRDLMEQRLGYATEGWSVKGPVAFGLSIDAEGLRSDELEGMESHAFQRTGLEWNMDALTRLRFTKMDNSRSLLGDLLFDHSTTAWSLQRAIPKFGFVRYQSETTTFDGLEANEEDFNRQGFAVEAKINENTKVFTEHETTNFADGQRESALTNTLQTKISERLGVAISDSRQNFRDENRSNVRRNYGAWWDFGGGFRLSYGYVRNMEGQDGTLRTEAKLDVDPKGSAQGVLWGLKFDSAHYTSQRWDAAERVRSESKMRLQTAKPIQLGLIRDLEFRYGIDALTDRSRYQRDNNDFFISGKLFGHTLGYEQRGQLRPDLNKQATERITFFRTNHNATAPLGVELLYRVRTTPEEDKSVIGRTINVTARPFRGLELRAQSITNPVLQRNNAMLGSVLDDRSLQRYSIAYTADPNFTFSGNFEQLEIGGVRDSLSRIAMLDITLFKSTGSPLTLGYGFELQDFDGSRRSQQRYQIRFDQRPGPNQTFSFFFSNINYGGWRPAGESWLNYNMRVDYRLRF